MGLFSIARAEGPALFVIFSSLADAQTLAPETTAGSESDLENFWWIALLIGVVAACQWFVNWVSGPDNFQISYSSDAVMRQSYQDPASETTSFPPRAGSNSSTLQDHIQTHANA